MYYTIYKITNLINQKYYIGKHKTKNLNDNYFGSGKAIKNTIKKYGKTNFKKEILFIFDSEDEMNQKEIELVNEELVRDPMTYNMSLDGHGSWSYVNANRDLYDNPMKNPEIAAKNLKSRNDNITEEIIKKKSETGKKNIQKAIQSNIGRKRPEHSKKIKEILRKKWEECGDEMRETLIAAKSKTFEIVKPNCEIIITNRLTNWCKDNNVSYGALLKIKREGQMKRGIYKGWQCKEI